MSHESAKPCGCDAGAQGICEQHREPIRGLNIAATYDGGVIGDCPTCDNYCLDPAEAPYCPTCARMNREGKSL